MKRVRFIAGLAEINKAPYFTGFSHFGATGRHGGVLHFFSPPQYTSNDPKITMNFFAHQDNARRRSRLLVFYYALALLLTWGGIYAVCMAFMQIRFASPENFLLLSGSFLAVAVIIGGGSLYKTWEMSAGGAYVASMLGAVEVDPGTNDPLERRLINVIQEMAIAAGIPVPQIFIMPEEQGINAFAAGFSTQDAAVCVTRGTLEYLNRDELQGVIGHEFSHVLNGDMRFNIRLIGFLFGLQMITILGWFLFRNAFLFGGGSRSGGNRNSGGGAAAVLLFGLAIMIIGSIGAFFCALIRAAISRQREYLADASAVQFTRNPNGIADALKKIGAASYGSKLDNTRAMEASHMFIASPFTSSFFDDLMASHPPLKDRIRAIDPAFDGQFPARVERLGTLSGQSPQERIVQKLAIDEVRKMSENDGLSDDVLSRDLNMMRTVASIVGSAGKPNLAETTNRLMGSIGQIHPEQLARAAAMMQAIPESLQSSIRDPQGAQAVVFALLLSRDADVRKKQLELLNRSDCETVAAQTAQLSDVANQLPEELRVPVVEMTFSALRLLDRARYTRFRGIVETLVQADGKIDLFEYTLQAMLLRDLDIHFSLAARLSVQYYSPKAVAGPFSEVLSILAYAGNDKNDEVQTAYQQGVTVFGCGNRISSQNVCNPARLDASLRVLVHAAMPVKERMLQAFIACIWSDGKVTRREQELLRAIAAMLGCPIPPLAQSE